MRWRVSSTYLEAVKGRDKLYVDVIVTPVRQRRGNAELQRRLGGIVDRALLRHEALREEARTLDRRANAARSKGWATRYRRAADALRAQGVRTERRAAQEVRRLERELSGRMRAEEMPSLYDIRNVYKQALREGVSPPGWKVEPVLWWHERGSGKTGSRRGSVEDLPSLFGPLSDHKATLVIGREDEAGDDDDDEREYDEDDGEDYDDA